jgi:hypothetical protein
LLFFFPSECDSLSYEEGKGLNDFGVIPEKAAVEVSKT